MIKAAINYDKVWEEISRQIAKTYDPNANYVAQIKNPETKENACISAFRRYLLECYSLELISNKSTDWHTFSADEAIQHELVIRHNWLPSVASALSHEELLIVFHEDLQTLKLPKDEYSQYMIELNHCGLRKIHESH